MSLFIKQEHLQEVIDHLKQVNEEEYTIKWFERLKDILRRESFVPKISNVMGCYNRVLGKKTSFKNKSRLIVNERVKRIKEKVTQRKNKYFLLKEEARREGQEDLFKKYESLHKKYFNLSIRISKNY